MNIFYNTTNKNTKYLKYKALLSICRNGKQFFLHTKFTFAKAVAEHSDISKSTH